MVLQIVWLLVLSHPCDGVIVKELVVQPCPLCDDSAPQRLRTICAGVLKSFLGVSASLASSIYLGAFQPDGLGFLLFVAVLPIFIGLATLPFLNGVPFVEQCEVEDGRRWFTTGMGSLLVALAPVDEV
jgi:hypothetical protein